MARNIDLYVNGELVATLYDLGDDVDITLYCIDSECNDISFRVAKSKRTIEVFQAIIQIIKKWLNEVED